MSLIPAWSHTFVEIDHEIISTVILLHAWFKNDCCQLQVKANVQSKLMVNHLVKFDLEKKYS